MYKFITSDAATLAKKRKQKPRACDQCRRKKRRCDHNIDPDDSQDEFHSVHDDEFLGSEGQEIPLSDNIQDFHDHDEQAAQQVRQGQQIKLGGQSMHALESPTSDYADNLNRPSAVRDVAESVIAQDGRGDETFGSRFIGDLSPEGILLAATSPGNTRGAALNDGVGVWLDKRASNGNQRTGSDERNPVPQMSLFHGSASLVQKVLLPVLEEEVLSTLPSQENMAALTLMYFEKCHPIFPVIDREGFQGLPSADPRRILLQQGICLAASRNFNAKEHLSLRGVESPMGYRDFGNRVFASMRLSVELAFVTDKIILIQALSLMCQFVNGLESEDLSSQLCGRVVHHAHYIGLHLERQQHQNDRDRYGVTLLCCVWTLDRMNAAFNGRPVLMHERDFGMDILECFKQQEPCFQLLLQVTMLLDKTIALYRPSSNQHYAGSEVVFPSFEEMVSDCGATQVVTSLLATIETLYHAVAMLSCRSKSWESLQRSSPSYLRQSLASLRISSISSRELRDQLVLFPFVPYAISLSLSIAYRDMRYSKVSMHRARSRAQVQTTCGILSELGDMFWSAATMSKMGNLTLQEMDRVVSVVAGSELRRTQNDGGNIDANISNGQSVSHFENANGPNTQLANPVSNFYFPPQDFDPSIFDVVSDVDLFDMFDPTFDLNGIDACLQGNLDLSFPTHFQ